MLRFVLAIVVLSVIAQAFRSFAPRARVTDRCTSCTRSERMANKGIFRTSLGMSDNNSEGGGAKGAAEDVSKYTVGQTLNGELVSSKDFGIFVQIEGSKTRVLLPRSLLSRGEFSKLTSMAESKAKISFDIASVDTEKNNLSGTYNSGVEKKDISSISDADIKSTEYPATVVGTHDFGMFVELDGFGVDGLVPASMGGSKGDYKVGDAVQVTVNEMADDGKKMTLMVAGASMGGGGGGATGSLEGTGFDRNRWIQGVVQSVSNFGLFVRPAGHDMVGLVHARQIPRDLIAALKKQVTVDSTGDKTDVEILFQEGDVVSCRVNSFGGPKKLDMSMLPPKDEEDDDDYVVDGRDPEEEEGQSGRPRRSSRFAETNVDSEAVTAFDGESKLLWWRGQPYTPLGRPNANLEDEEMAVIKESTDVVEGVWRRMFEVDLREDAADFSSKIEEAELKELQNDIGELMGLDDDMFAMADLNLMSSGPKSVGGHNMGLLDELPDDWKSEMTFFKDVGNTASSLDAMYKGGKASEQQEFDALIREVEVEIGSKKTGMPEIEDVPEVAPEAVSAEPAASAAQQEAAEESSEEPPAEAPAEAEA